MDGTWLEQYNRIKRHYDRFVALNNGRQHDMLSENYIDDVYNFFINCYHLKDWIKNDSKVSPAVVNDVEAYINSTRQLVLCADICNGRKHLVLNTHIRHHNRPPTENPTFGPKRFALSLGAATPTLSLSYEINTDAGPIDAFQLATDCVAAWDTFLSARGLN
jgi:hypothetical protein